MLNSIQRKSLQNAGQAETMVAVKMCDENFCNACRGNIGESHLPLRSFARIEQKSFFVPPQKIAVVIPLAGRHLAGGSEGNESSGGHI